MNEPFTTIPWREKVQNKTLFVIVQSIPSDTKYRDIWRKTWQKYANTRTSVLFLLGRVPNIKHEIEKKILEEKNRYGDIIEVNGLIENYHNLTFKSLYTLKFFLDHTIPSGPSQYVLKVDTDSIVILPKLYNLLTTKYQNIKYLMLGKCFCCGGSPAIGCTRFEPITKNIVKNTKEKKIEIRPKDNNLKKWEIPRYIYNGEYYPSYLNGPGYVLSRSSAECIYKMALKTPIFPLEDIFITGFLAQQCGITRRGHIGFTGIGKAHIQGMPHTRKQYTFNFDTDILNHRNYGATGVDCEEDMLGVATKYAQLLRMGLINRNVTPSN